MLRGGNVLSYRMLSVIKQAIAIRRHEVMNALKKSFIDSMRLDSIDEDATVQVIINEFGEITQRESLEGVLPNSVGQSKAYIIYECSCVDVLKYYDKYELLDRFDLVEPFKERHERFVNWLKQQGLVGEIEFSPDNYVYREPGDLVYEIYERYTYPGGGGRDCRPYLDLVCKWSPMSITNY